MTTSWRTFLSYSRRQYYFAESLALHLQHLGYAIWFDIQQIEPGVNWQADIEDGLKRSETITLVASRSAIKSPYVEREWRRAMDEGRPIFVALCESVRLPRDLRQNATIIDFRRDFEAGVQRLAQGLGNPSARRGRPPLTLLPGLPAGVRRLALALMLDDLKVLLGFLLAFGILDRLLTQGSALRAIAGRFLNLGAEFDALAQPVLIGLGILLLVRYLGQFQQRFKGSYFLRHEFDYQPLIAHIRTKMDWVGVGQIGLMLFVPHYGAALALTGQLPYVADVLQQYNWIYTVLFILIVQELLGIATWRLLPKGPDADILRWAQPGKIPASWREQLNRGLIISAPEKLPSEEQIQHVAAYGAPMPSVTAAGTPHTYAIVSAPEDSASVQQVTQAIERLGFQRTAQNPACTLLILSYRTPLALVKDCLRNNTGVIGLLVTDVCLPDDLPELTSLQLVDYRPRHGPELFAALQYLTTDSDESRASFSQRLLPVNLAVQTGNPGLQSLFSTLMATCLINLLFVVYYLGRLSLITGAVAPPQAGHMPEIAGCAALLVIDLVLGWFALGVLSGRARFSLRLLWIVAVLPAGIMALVELASRLIVPVGPLDLLGTTFQTVLGARPTLALIGCYALAVLNAMLAEKNETILVRPGASVLGMPRLRLSWGAMISALIAIIAAMALAQFVQL